MEARVTKLEADVAELHTDVSVIKNDLVHGGNVFDRLEASFANLSTRLTVHMEREEGRQATQSQWLIGTLLAIVLSLVGYIWVAHLG